MADGVTAASAAVVAAAATAVVSAAAVAGFGRPEWLSSHNLPCERRRQQGASMAARVPVPQCVLAF